MERKARVFETVPPPTVKRKGEEIIFGYPLLNDSGLSVEKKIEILLYDAPRFRRYISALEKGDPFFVALSDDEINIKKPTRFDISHFFTGISPYERIFRQKPSQEIIAAVKFWEDPKKAEIHAVEVEQVFKKGSRYIKTDKKVSERLIEEYNLEQCSDQDEYTGYINDQPGLEVIKEGKGYRIINTPTGIFRIKFTF